MAFAAGKETCGLAKMGETFGSGVAALCAKWLGYQAGADARPATAAALARPGTALHKDRGWRIAALVDETEAAILAANRGLCKRERQLVENRRNRSHRSGREKDNRTRNH